MFYLRDLIIFSFLVNEFPCIRENPVYACYRINIKSEVVQTEPTGQAFQDLLVFNILDR